MASYKHKALGKEVQTDNGEGVWHKDNSNSCTREMKPMYVHH